MVKKKGNKRKAPPTRILVMILIISIALFVLLGYFAYLIYHVLEGTEFCLAILIVLVIGTSCITGFIMGLVKFYSR